MKLFKITDNTNFNEAGIFASQDWIAIFGDKGRSFYLGSENNPIGALNLFEYKKMGKVFVIHPPFSQHCGLEISGASSKQYSQISEVKRALRALVEFFKTEHHGSYIDLALPTSITDVQPFLSEGYKAEVAYTYRLDIIPKEHDLLASFSSERRKNVRDAQKKNFEIQINHSAVQVIERVQNTLEQSGLNYDYNYLREILDAEWSFSISCLHKNKVIATAVIVYDTTTAYYVAGGSSKDSQHAGAASLVLWEAILESKKRGVSVFDFCGSSVPSIEKFFRGFGGNLTPFFRIRNNNFLVDLLKKTKAKIS